MNQLKRGTLVQIEVNDKTPYKIFDKNRNLLGVTEQNDMGVYLVDVTFDVIGDTALIKGKYMGDLEKLRLNISDGIGVMFDPKANVFTDGKDVIRSARMLQVFDGIIKIVL